MKTMMKRCAIGCLLAAIVCAGSVSRAEDGISNTTGLPTDQPYRPVLVNLSNVEGARPIHGIAAADIVYEAIYWGPCHTRYLAVFGDEHPEAVGSIRGARLYQMQIRQGWDAPYASWGGQLTDGSNYRGYLDGKGVPDAFRIDGVHAYHVIANAVMYREADIVAPNNLFLKLQTYVDAHWPQAEDGKPYAPQKPALVFSDDAPTAGAKTATRVEVRYDPSDRELKYNPSYVYDENTRTYIRHYNGEAQKDATDDRQVVAANIIVQYCDLTYNAYDAACPLIETVGESEMHAYIGGTRIDGTWKRQTDNDPTQYLDKEGNPIVLLPGKTFIQMVPLEFDMAQDGDAFSYTWKEGANTSKWKQ